MNEDSKVEGKCPVVRSLGAATRFGCTVTGGPFQIALLESMSKIPHVFTVAIQDLVSDERNNMFDISLVNYKLLAIDYGKSGGYVWNCFNRLEFKEMPKTIREKRWDMIEIDPRIVVAEVVHSMPGQGIASTGVFMRETGEIDGLVLGMTGDVVRHVNPLEWQSYFTLKTSKHFETKTKWKKHLQSIANDYTGMDWNLSCSDAALIWCYYAARELKIPSPVELKI